MKEVEVRVIVWMFWYDGNLVMIWMMGNVVVKIDVKENIYLCKENDNDFNCKIDGLVILIMVMGCVLVVGVDDGDDFMNVIWNLIIV